MGRDRMWGEPRISAKEEAKSRVCEEACPLQTYFEGFSSEIVQGSERALAH